MTEKEWKSESLRQYFKYFRFWFLALGILLVIFVGFLVVRLTAGDKERQNTSAPKERVYDYAGVLSAEEEEKLRQLIAKKEAKIGCDLVLVTTREEIGERPSAREKVLRDMADDFYDDNLFGFDAVHGSGALLMDNWYEGQMSTWLSTCGAVYKKFSNRDIDDVLDAVYAYIETDPYRAYCAYVDTVADKMSGKGSFRFFPILILILPIVAMLVFVTSKLKNPIGQETVSPVAYVVGGRPTIRVQTDQLMRKMVTKRRIPRVESSGGGSSGGGGGHTSSGGVSHGGGGRSR